MSLHDPFCKSIDWMADPHLSCQRCVFLYSVRQDERRRVLEGQPLNVYESMVVFPTAARETGTSDSPQPANTLDGA